MTRREENETRKPDIAQIYIQDLTKEKMHLMRFKEILTTLNVVKNVELGIIPNHKAWCNLLDEIYFQCFEENPYGEIMELDDTEWIY